jgi:hypothetical protein
MQDVYVPTHDVSAPFTRAAWPPISALLFMSEAIGKADNMRVEGRQLPSKNSYVAGYTVHEGGVAVRQLLAGCGKCS